MKKIKYSVFICDDEEDQIALIERCINHAGIILSDEDKIKFEVVCTAKNFIDAIKYVESSSLKAGIYFIDIEIGKKLYEKNGLDLAETIKKRDKNAQVIFVTSHQDLAFLTFKRRLGAADFIVKNGNMSDLQKSITAALENVTKVIANINIIERSTFSYKFGQEIKNISLDEVIYITTTDVPHRLRLVETTGWADFFGGLKEISQKYDDLVQISQSCIINPKNVNKVNFKIKQIYFINGDKVNFSVRNTHKIRTLFKMKNK